MVVSNQENGRGSLKSVLGCCAMMNSVFTTAVPAAPGFRSEERQGEREKLMHMSATLT